ncbi:MAG: diguanylate cyclase [Gemmatimonadetes bacterium]|nr:diguanylate cyclase [Gemmatimonadota bacterium]
MDLTDRAADGDRAMRVSDSAGGAQRPVGGGRRSAPKGEDLLDAPFSDVIHRLTRIAAKVVDAPVALFTLVAEEGQVCRSCVAPSESWVPADDAPLAYALCERTMALGAPLVIDDARSDGRLGIDPAGLGAAVSYAGIPLITDGHAIGTLCVIDFHPRRWADEEVRTLEELAAALASKIELRIAARESDAKGRAAARADEALRESEARFRTAFDAAPIGMALTAMDGRWLRVNDALCVIVGYAREELLTQKYSEITHPDDRPADRALAERLIAGEVATGAREKRFIRKDGREIWVQVNASLVRDSRGEPFHFIIQMQDITERRTERERLRELSLRDELTGLYNRRAFLIMAGERLKLARRTDERLVLLFGDIDDMKWVNDTYGHLEGDRALATTARLLRESFRDSDLIARLGGDEFAVLAGGTSEADLAPLLHRFREQLAAANDETRRPYELKVSIGATPVMPQDNSSIGELVERADIRMYQAKGRRTAG